MAVDKRREKWLALKRPDKSESDALQSDADKRLRRANFSGDDFGFFLRKKIPGKDQTSKK